jgi:very-short-patch-repair endonuclease
MTFLEHKGSNWLIKLFSGTYRDAKRKFKIMFPATALSEAEDVLRSTRHFANELRSFYGQMEEFGLIEFGRALKTTVPSFSLENIPQLMDGLRRINELENVMGWINGFAEVELDNTIKELVYSGRASDVKRAIDIFEKTVTPVFASHNEALRGLTEFGEIDPNRFYGSDKRPLSAMIEKHQALESSTHEIGDWIEYCRSSETIIKFDLKWIIEAIKTTQIKPEESEKAFNFAYFQTLALQVMRQAPELGGFSRQAHEQKIKQFQTLDSEIIKLNRQLIAANAANVVCPPGVQTGRVGSLTEMGLLKNEIRKRSRHIPIRAAIQRAPKSIQALKPCFMMSPMSCSQYLAPGLIEFDLIVMDEASQIRPEDALGALVRAKQVVVVGDPKQLPPTSFFDRKFETSGDENKENSITDESESILDVCLKAFKRPRRLSWHYRSQHESLIAFSNQQFYGGGLMLFPSPKEPGIDYGIKRHYVENGRFINQFNIEEAKMVVNAVVEHFRAGKTESLGVVAMNVNQARYISGLIDDECKKDPSLDAAMASQGENGHSFFVKNLENVQGDERDVIFISATYGPDQTGQQHQRFGPINQSSGGRRLNVLITRAKKRVELFTSMLSSNIIISSESKEGVIALKGYLKFAETQLLEPLHTNHGNKRAVADSPFEEAVASIIKMAGYDVDIQVGAAGYFIDIAVKHPDNPSEYLLAVECDGATYHSSLSARDRDRLREAVLRRMGWEVHRIWSTDWFNNRSIEISRLIGAIENTKRARPIAMKRTIVESKSAPEVVVPIERKNTPIQESADLKRQLTEFRDNIIAQRYSIDRHCLLSDDMIKALSDSKPTSRTEFWAKIPEHMRTNINPEQMEFIDDVLEIIELF